MALTEPAGEGVEDICMCVRLYMYVHMYTCMYVYGEYMTVLWE